MDIESIKNWLIVEHEADDDVIKDLIASAKAELNLSGVSEYSAGEPGYPLYCLAIKYIVARDYETRGYTEQNPYTKQFNEKALENMILKLKSW
ncbi:phage head-tail adapter protein [Mammaliicoccus sciuri]|uniref:head-tail connector protein n=1 Tax=Mammaliicoccus sciuri TaxID=1296 RepID=UPI00073483D2|nr:head-tail connector protein [Mammaliicoccus sciuri]KTT82724.1 phage head-tail adapter protein [Mammaliicoccus sciuri]KTT88219.1 phage head-tail adapter protein [Mammaliicoccus sciuri]KTT89762.1 phage head-tail adapter protein [Mammaliicoccus sciuri]KTT94154.1 phage head-tail adapter protein [Mammaliicoccus sciuri]KTW10740.1 phage head-tail adapter protein [Mammaliicoccus sciuri]